MSKKHGLILLFIYSALLTKRELSPLLQYSHQIYDKQRKQNFVYTVTSLHVFRLIANQVSNTAIQHVVVGLVSQTTLTTPAFLTNNWFSCSHAPFKWNFAFWIWSIETILAIKKISCMSRRAFIASFKFPKSFLNVTLVIAVAPYVVSTAIFAALMAFFFRIP